MNCTMMFAVPSDTKARISSMPLTAETASSIGSTIWDTISSGLEPGSCTRTFTVAGSLLGNRSTPNWRKLKKPITTRNRISMEAKMGRLTQISVRFKRVLRRKAKMIVART